MHSMGKTLAELHAMLKLHEKGIPKKAETPSVLAIHEGKIQKDKKKKPQRAKGKAKEKNRLAYTPKTKILPPPKRDNPANDFIYHHYKEGLRESRKLKHEAVSLYMGNGMRATVEAIRSFDLILPTRILNMVPTKKVDRMPYEIWHGKALKSSYLRVWGSYPKETMGYYFYYLLENKIFVSRNVEFFKNSFMVQEASGSHRLLKMSRSDKGLEIIQEEDTQPSENTSKEHNEVAPIEVEPQNVRVPIPRSTRIPQVPDRHGYYVDIKEYELWDLDEPPNYKAALADPESDKWLEAMNTEICKWLFKKNTDMDGNVYTFKARLVAKGFTQTYRVDYGETFSPIADIKAIRILLVMAAFYDYEIWQMDVKKAFLNSHLSKDVYGATRRVCGSKTSQQASGSDVAFLVLYVDDILVMGNSVTMLKEVKSWLCKCFSMKDLEEAAYILGIKMIHDRSKRLIALSQSAYLEKILKKFRMENSKKGYTSMMEKPNASAIGLIMYAVRCTRYYVAFAQNFYSHFQQNPGEIHWTAVKIILKYLRNTKDVVLVYGAKPEDEMKVSCCAVASFQTDKDDINSQTGYVFILNGGAVDWKSAKQSTTAMSSTEVEYVAAAKASMEAVWMRKFIDGLGGVMPSNKRPMEILCDNKPAFAIASDLEILKGARHF
ncbi:retrotransposon protein, putative, ty1-copia subclass [Tanacetum coccineum]